MRADLLEELERRVREAMPWIVSIRRELHRNPELRFEEFRTAERLTEELSGMEMPVRTGLAGTGVAAVMTGDAEPEEAGDDAIGRSGRKKIHTLALRADMDGLPVSEATGLTFASERPGVMHACGHDAHSAMVLGAARVLASSSMLRKALPGQLKFVFQPAEEGGMGARAMIGAGVLEDPAVEAALAIHVFPNLPTGQVAVYPRYSHASADSFSVTFRGRGGHGGYPNLARDPLTPMAETLLAYRTLISREVDPLDSASLSVCMVRAGEADNVVPDVAELKGALRTLGEELRLRLQGRMVEIAEGMAAAHRVEAQVLFHGGCPATLNHAGMSAVIEEEARDLLTDDGVHLPSPTLGAEDFGYFTQAVPGALFRLGCTPATASRWEPLHSPRFQLDEGCMEIGVQLLLRSAFRLLVEGIPETEVGVIPEIEDRAYGGILVDPQGRICLIRPRGRELWAFPKGHAEADESPPQAATREVREETGYPVWVGDVLGDLIYCFPATRKGQPVSVRKTVRFFVMSPAEEAGVVGTPCPKEIEACAWFSLEEAREALGYPLERELLASVESTLRELFAVPPPPPSPSN